MKTLSLFASSLLCGFVLMADEAKPLDKAELDLLKRNYNTLSPAERVQRQAAAEHRFLLEEGGAMIYPGTPSGQIVIANLQKRVPDSGLLKLREGFASMKEYDLVFTDAERAAAIVIRIVDKPGARALTVWPDESQAEVNVAALAIDNPKPAFLAARTRKEVLRAFSCLTAGSTYELALFGKIKSPKDLDDVASETFPVDIVMRTTSFMKGAGIVPIRRATYREVLEGGYDVAPTNAYQKAIYADVKKTVRLTRKVPSAR